MTDNQHTQKPLKPSVNKFQFFPEEQIKNIVALVNHDAQLAELGKELKVTLTMAVKMNETGESHRFGFENGKITSVTKGEDAEFVISGPEEIWQQIFSRKMDPFVATSQNKLKLKGNFIKLSRWYAPFSRIFELWSQA